MVRMAWSWFLLEIMAIKSTYWLIATAVFGLVFLVSFIKTPIKVSLARGLLVSYAFLIVVCTTLNRGISAETYNFVPLWSYRVYFFRGQTDVITQAFLNVVMFIPFGFLSVIVIESYFKRKSNTCKAIIAVLTATVLSVAIEVAQLITHKGLCEIDDVIHNSLGAIIGCGCCHLMKKRMWRYIAGFNEAE